eukprot:Polyplicarium_translucidae@DN2929_c0_g1_i2.p1
MQQDQLDVMETEPRGGPPVASKEDQQKEGDESPVTAPTKDTVEVEGPEESSKEEAGAACEPAEIAVGDDERAAVDAPKPAARRPAAEQLTSFADAKGRLAELARVQSYSRQIQRIVIARPDLADEMLAELMPDLAGLMVDPYANYLCQEIFCRISAESSDAAVEETLFRPTVYEVAKDRRGTHSLIALLESCKEESKRRKIADHFGADLDRAGTDTGAVGLLCRILTGYDVAATEGLIRQVAAKLLVLIKHTEATLLVKAAVSAVTHDTALRELFVNRLLEDLDSIVGDGSAAVVLIHIFSTWGSQKCGSIISKISENAVAYSGLQFPSVVVERCISMSSPEQFQGILERLTDRDALPVVVNSNFGVYVLQRAMLRATAEECQALRSSVKGIVPTITDTEGASPQHRQRWEGLLAFLEERCNPRRPAPLHHAAHRQQRFAPKNTPPGHQGFVGRRPEFRKEQGGGGGGYHQPHTGGRGRLFYPGYPTSPASRQDREVGQFDQRHS